MVGSPGCGAIPFALHGLGARAIASTVIPVGQALRTVLDATPVLGAERVLLPTPLPVAWRRRTSGRERTVPARANSAMDGFAVRGEDVRNAPARLRIVGSAPAGTLLDVPVLPGTAAKIFTGSVVPDGADTVVKVEDTEEGAGVVTVRVPIAAGANVRLPGEDIRQGALVVEAGTVLGAADLGVLASVGAATSWSTAGRGWRSSRRARSWWRSTRSPAPGRW